MKSKEQELYEMCENMCKFQEMIDGEMHIIDMAPSPKEADEGKFRIYHKSGYCVDVIKEVEDENEKTGKIRYYYDMTSEWQGFIQADAKTIIEAIKYNIE